MQQQGPGGQMPGAPGMYPQGYPGMPGMTNPMGLPPGMMAPGHGGGFPYLGMGQQPGQAGMYGGGDAGAPQMSPMHMPFNMQVRPPRPPPSPPTPRGTLSGSLPGVRSCCVRSARPCCLVVGLRPW